MTVLSSSWLTFCSPSKLCIVISSANIQTLLLMTLPHGLLLTNYLCFVTKENTKNEHPTSALFPNKFIHCTDFTKGFRNDQPLSLLVCLFSFSKAMRSEILEPQLVSEAWRGVSEIPNTYSKLETSCHTSTRASVFFLSLITCPYQPCVQSSNPSGQFLCPSYNPHNFRISLQLLNTF